MRILKEKVFSEDEAYEICTGLQPEIDELIGKEFSEPIDFAVLESDDSQIVGGNYKRDEFLLVVHFNRGGWFTEGILKRLHTKVNAILREHDIPVEFDEHFVNLWTREYNDYKVYVQGASKVKAIQPKSDGTYNLGSDVKSSYTVDVDGTPITFTQKEQISNKSINHGTRNWVGSDKTFVYESKDGMQMQVRAVCIAGPLGQDVYGKLM